MAWFGSQPPSHPPHVAVISRTELAAYLAFFEWNVDPISCSKDGDGRDEHRPSADPEGNAKTATKVAQSGKRTPSSRGRGKAPTSQGSIWAFATVRGMKTLLIWAQRATGWSISSHSLAATKRA